MSGRPIVTLILLAIAAVFAASLVITAIESIVDRYQNWKNRAEEAE